MTNWSYCMLDENIIATLARTKVVSDTFRRLPPEKKELIYTEAIGLFGRYGYDGLPVDRLCKEAGISKGSFFQYFPSKMHLLEFVVLLFDHRLAQWMAEVRATESSSRAADRLAHLYDAAVANTKLSPAETSFYLFVTHAVEHAGVLIEGIDVERHLEHYVRQIVERGVQTGEIRGDIAPDQTAYLIAVVVAALISREYRGKGSPAQSSSDQLISVLFDGIRV